MARLVVPFILLALIVAASVVTDRPLPRADFTYADEDVNTLDLQKMSWMQDLRVAMMLYEGLVRQDVFTRGYEVVPGVAERWEVSPDQLEYTFHLRSDAKWSNGRPVTAGDFVFSWRRAILPDTGSDYVTLFTSIEGVEEFLAWRTAAIEAYPGGPQTDDAARTLWAETERQFDELVSVRAVDDRTLWVRLREPTPYFLDLCAFPLFYPVYPPLLRRHESLNPATGQVKTETGWTKPDRLVTNGPFVLTVWRFKRDMYFERNEHFWDRDLLNVDTVQMLAISDANAQVLAFQTGAVDWLPNVTVPYRGDMYQQKRAFLEEHSAEVERLRAEGLDQFQIDRMLPNDPRAHTHGVPSFATYWYNFNCLPTLPDGRRNPFHDARVRRAFAMTVDKRAIVDRILRTGSPVARTLIPEGAIGGYTPPRGLKCVSDARTESERAAIVAEARALLAEAGYPNPAEFVPVEILFNKDAGHDLVAQVVQKNWQEYLGVPVRLVQRDLKVVRDDLKRQNYIVSRAGWYADYGDPTTFLDLSRSTDANNDRKYNNPEYDALLDKAKAERDPVARMRILESAERMLMDRDLPILPVYHYNTIYVFDAHRISGLNPHPRMTQLIYLVDVLGDGKGRDRPMRMRDSVDESPYAPMPGGG